ncbi:helix-turn-helix transcriptional regulator [Streptomyces sp. AN091965]|uniref:helix-turn-helix transcriptional regulator n=1 Tax=Streptomyces sp. AN091965 TaxID=2927803 RepID=UPI001F623EEC|nr:helix-turn-helix transcriptional regulator [Streptomyces sp. AN091965]MCI3928274.1 helix-turn-helix transcriptional regulator [Streptomyces sp. AN091965]
MNLEDLVRLRRAKDVMDRDYARPLDVPALAKVALMSSGHFSRSFRAAYGETPYNYLMTRRVERAKALLRRGDMSVTEVCFAVGCTSLGSFSSRFTELVGESPSAYRARDHGAGAGIPACVAKIHTRPVKNGGPALAPEGSGQRTGERGAGGNGSSGVAGKPVTIGEADSTGAS